MYHIAFRILFSTSMRGKQAAQLLNHDQCFRLYPFLHKDWQKRKKIFLKMS